MPRNLANLVAHWARTRPDEIAVWDETRAVSWRLFDTRTQAIAAALRDMGHAEGARVAVLSENRVEWCEVAIAALRAGMIVVPLNAMLAPSELAYISDDAAVDVVFASRRHTQLCENMIALQSGPPPTVVPFESEHFVTMPDTGATFDAVTSLTEDDIALLQYTSGTTGRPKGVALTHGNMLAVGETLYLIDPAVVGNLRTLVIAPMHFTGALNSCFLALYVLGGGTYLVDGFDPGRCLELLVQHRISLFVAVPVIMSDVAEHPNFATADLTAIRLGITGAAVVPVNVMKKWHSKGVMFRQCYSLTEGGGYTCAPTVEQALVHPERIGSGVGHTEVRVIDEDGSECPVGTPGELVVRGPAVTRSYWNDPEATEQAFASGGWLRTGDIALEHDDGTFSIVDRKKDLIISGGINVYPAEIERVIYQLEAVEEVAVVGMPDERWQEVPLAYVRARSPLQADEVLVYCRQHLAGYKVPKQVVFIENPLPRTASGKILKRELERGESSSQPG